MGPGRGVWERWGRDAERGNDGAGTRSVGTMGVKRGSDGDGESGVAQGANFSKCPIAQPIPAKEWKRGDRLTGQRRSATRPQSSAVSVGDRETSLRSLRCPEPPPARFGKYPFIEHPSPNHYRK
jgi:hypothetical protein